MVIASCWRGVVLAESCRGAVEQLATPGTGSGRKQRVQREKIEEEKEEERRGGRPGKRRAGPKRGEEVVR